MSFWAKGFLLAIKNWRGVAILVFPILILITIGFVAAVVTRKKWELSLKRQLSSGRNDLIPFVVSRH